MDFLQRCILTELQLESEGFKPRTCQAAVKMGRRRALGVAHRLPTHLQETVALELFTAEYGQMAEYCRRMEAAGRSMSRKEWGDAYVEGMARKGVKVGPETRRKFETADFLG